MRKLSFILGALLLIGASQLVRSNPPMPLPSPQIVASVALLNQTANIPPTTVYTPTVDGVFHIDGYEVFTNSSFASNNTNIGIQWTDELAFRSNTQFCNVPTSSSTLGYCQGDIVIHALAGQPIQFLSGAPTTGTPFNLYLTVVKE